MDRLEGTTSLVGSSLFPRRRSKIRADRLIAKMATDKVITAVLTICKLNS